MTASIVDMKKVEKKVMKMGNKDGITQAKQEFEAQEPEISTEDIERAVHYYSLIHVFGYWVDSFVMLNPQFMRSDYFTEEE